jgi:hypothetical protein
LGVDLDAEAHVLGLVFLGEGDGPRFVCLLHRFVNGSEELTCALREELGDRDKLKVI